MNGPDLNEIRDASWLGPLAQAFSAQVATADTGLVGAKAVLVVQGADGLYIGLGAVKGVTGTTSNGMVRLFLEDPAGNRRLLDEVAITGSTSSATVKTPLGEWQPTRPIPVPRGWKILASTHVGETFNVFMWGGMAGPDLRTFATVTVP